MTNVSDKWKPTATWKLVAFLKPSNWQKAPEKLFGLQEHIC